MNLSRHHSWAAVCLACIACIACAQTRGRVPESTDGAAGAEAYDIAWEVVGASTEGRALEAVTYGDGRVRVYVIAGIHGDEVGGVQNVGRLHLLLSSETPAGVCVRVLRDVNPDGTWRGTRTSARKVDLNRNWPASNFRAARGRGAAPLSEPETAAGHADLVAFRPQVIVALHGARKGPFVNFDGPAQELSRAFVGGALTADERWHVEPQMGYATPGSLGSWLGVDLGMPVLTIEFDRTQGGEEVWPSLRNGMLALLTVLARGELPRREPSYDMR